MGVWLRRVGRILRGVYSGVTLQATRVRMGDDEWYDVAMWNQFNSLIYMDVLDEAELGGLVEALTRVCGEPVWRAELLDGFTAKFEGCASPGEARRCG